jgi:CPA2 family monovalent cation:H+ antiporter-2
MPHVPPLVSTLAIGLVLAFSLGVLANRFKLPPLIGYLVAGIIIGPFTPGFVADQNIANQLAEVGVILLMFGVGLHFSLEELLSVRAIAVPGAVAQAIVATPLAMALAWWLGWTPAAGLIFGIALSVAGTVVLLRLLQERRLLETERGRITVGWLIVQDIAMVLVLVLLPGLTDLFRDVETAPNAGEIIRSVGVMLGKLGIFLAVMLVVGKKLIPAILHYVAHTGSRELFRLAVLAVAIGVAYAAAQLFGVSLALGAFFAGMMLSESRLSQQAATESLPLRDAFAVLFFVSVGMLFDPTILVEAPFSLLATVFIIVIGKSIAAYYVVRLYSYPRSAALMIAASLAQIGEFSFILANFGLALGILSPEGRTLIIAGAIITILLNPLLFMLLDHLAARRGIGADAMEIEKEEVTPAREPIVPTSLTDHVVLVGHGRVGSFISAELIGTHAPLFVIEDNTDTVQDLNRQGIEAISGNAADPELLPAANLKAARFLIVAIPDAFEGGQVVQQARTINPTLPIIARAHSEEEIEHLIKHGANFVVMGEHEIAKAMLETVGKMSASIAQQSDIDLSARSTPGLEEKLATPKGD